MKPSEQFKKTILAHLETRAQKDELFALSFSKSGKSIDECCNFILNTVKESGCNGFCDDEIFSIATHYYDEDELDPKYLKQINGSVVVNHQIELTDEEKAELAQKARNDFYEKCLAKQRELNKPKKAKQTKQENQLTLF